MTGAERHRHAQRQHGFQAFAGEQDRRGLAYGAEADAVPEKMAHRASRRCDRRFPAAINAKPGAMNAGERARLVGDGGDHSGEFEQTARVDIPMEAAGMKPQREFVVANADAALDEIGLGDRAG